LLLAEARVTVLTGGLAAGVMGSVAAGVRQGGGTCIGILPSFESSLAAPDLTVALTTGLHELRNGVLVSSARALIAIGGGWGTLSEVALALRQGKRVVSLRSWAPDSPDGAGGPRPIVVETPEEAVALVLALLDSTDDGRYSLWLEPAAPEAISSLVERVCAACGAKPFPAHMTLSSCTGLPLSDLEAACERIAARLAPLDFRPNGFASFADEEHRILVVPGARDDALERALATASQELPQGETAPLPHISLLYGHHDHAALTRVLPLLADLPPAVELGYLTLRDTTPADHEQWSPALGRWPLRE
jgi:hypothetical protein